jgi:hypothetical protein
MCSVKSQILCRTKYVIKRACLVPTSRIVHDAPPILGTWPRLTNILYHLGLLRCIHVADAWGSYMPICVRCGDNATSLRAYPPCRIFDIEAFYRQTVVLFMLSKVVPCWNYITPRSPCGGTGRRWFWAAQKYAERAFLHSTIRTTTPPTTGPQRAVPAYWCLVFANYDMGD